MRADSKNVRAAFQAVDDELRTAALQRALGFKLGHSIAAAAMTYLGVSGVVSSSMPSR